MKTNIQTRRLGCQGRLLLGLCLILSVASTCRAVSGVADTVILMGDMTDTWKWPRELVQWQKAAALAQSQVQELGRIKQTIGDAAASVSKVVESVSSVTDSLSGLAALEESEAYAKSAASKFMPGASSEPVDTTQKVGANMDVFGAKIARDTLRYKAGAILLALRQRQSEAESKLEELVSTELTEQKNLLGKLKQAVTQLDVEAVQAALAASQQRIELARLKLGQVVEQSGLMEARVKLEKARKDLADQEWAQKIAEKLKARALTALHAQKGQSS